MRLNDYYESLDRVHLERRFAQLEKRPLREGEAEDFWQDIESVFSIHHPDTGQRHYMMPTETRTYPAGAIFWRGRAAKGDLPTGERRIQDVQGLWARPHGTGGSPGRLNRADESLLYTCVLNPYAVPDELHLSDGEDLYLIKYETTRDISVNWVGGPLTVEDLSERAARNAQIVRNALARFFSRPVERTDDAKPVYALSELIAKSLFDLPEEVQDGWIFPSVHDGNSMNAVFRPEKSREFLKVVGVCLCTAHRAEQRKTFLGHFFTDGTVEDGGFRWEKLGTEVQRSSFPEFS